MGFGEGGTKTFGGTLTQPRPDEFGMRQRSGEYFALNTMLSSFGMDFALKFGGEDQKKKKRPSLQNLRLLDLSCCFIDKKRLWLPVFGQKFAVLLVLVQKFTLAREAQAVIWGVWPKKPPPCIGVARIFDWGKGQTKNDMQ